MKNGSAGAVTPANTYSDKDILTNFHKFKKDKRLVLDGFKEDGKKIQKWEAGEPNIDEHLDPKAKRNYGCNNAYKDDAGNLVASNCVIDVDGFKESGKTVEEFCNDIFQIDTKAIPFRSPSGENWHLWKYYKKPVPVEKAAADARSLGHKIKKLGYKVDFGKCNPTKSGGDIGINLPFAKRGEHDYQRPYDPRGNLINNFQLAKRIYFQDFPYIAAIINLAHGANRHDALLYAAAQLFHAGKFKLEFIKDIKNSLDNTGKDKIDEEWFERVILTNKDYETYDLKTETVEEKIGDAVGIENYKFKSDWEETKAQEPMLDELDEVAALDVFEHTGKEVIEPRKWVVPGWMMEKCLTILAGQPGIGKTIILHMLAWCLATGVGFFGKPIFRTGNVLIIAAEETINEINLRLKAIQQFLGGELTTHKIYKRGLEQDLKLIKFKKDSAVTTAQYHQLEKLIKDKNIKHIILDPLINFQSGSYDENSNQNMEEYIKNTLIPLTFLNEGTLIAGHHTNKLSMIRIDEDSKDIEIDPQSALTAPRGASSLVGAARFVIAMQPMLKKIWKKFAEHVKDGSTFIHYTGLIEAKSNYNLVADDIAWLKKNTVEVAATDPDTGEVVQEKTGVFSVSILSEISKSKLKLKAAENELYVRSKMPLIKSMFDAAGDDKISLNSVVVRLLGQDPRMAEPDIKESTIKTDIRRKIINGLGGAEAGRKGQLERAGLEYDDGYNYWYSVEKNGQLQNWFIERGKDFKR
jgi:hypothetical protein